MWQPLPHWRKVYPLKTKIAGLILMETWSTGELGKQNMACHCQLEANFLHSRGQEHNTGVYKHVCISKRGWETTRAWTKLPQIGTGQEQWLHHKPQVTMFRELVGPA